VQTAWWTIHWPNLRGWQEADRRGCPLPPCSGRPSQAAGGLSSVAREKTCHSQSNCLIATVQIAIRQHGKRRGCRAETLWEGSFQTASRGRGRVLRFTTKAGKRTLVGLGYKTSEAMSARLNNAFNTSEVETFEHLIKIIPNWQIPLVVLL
jgi:hypothetical protein